MLSLRELRKRLTADDWKTRYYATFNLGRMSDLSDVGELVKVALEDKNEFVREGAVRSLINIGGSKAARALEKALTDEYVGVRQRAATGLGEIGDTGSVNDLVRALKDDDLKVRENAIKALGEMGDQHALLPLFAVQRVGKGEFWLSAKKALNKIRSRGRKSQIKTIKELIANETREQPDNRISNELIELAKKLYNWFGSIRPRILKKLGKSMDIHSVILLDQALKFGGKRARMSAVKALAEIDCLESHKLLVFAVKDSNKSVSREAVKQLIRLGKTVVEPLIEDLISDEWHHRQLIAGVLVEIGVPAVEALCQKLSEENTILRIETVKILGRLGGEQAKNCLIDALTNEANDSVRAEIAIVVGRLNDQMALEPLINVLTYPERRFRIDAADALGILRNSLAVDALLERLEDDDTEVRKHAAHALARIGDKRAVEPIFNKYKNENSWGYSGTIAREYILALAEIGDARAVKPLTDMTRFDSNLGYRALEALGKKIPQVDNDYYCEKCNCRAIRFSSGVSKLEAINIRLFSHYYACRSCGSNSYLLSHVKRVVLVLDKQDRFTAADAEENSRFERKDDVLIFKWNSDTLIMDYNEIWIKNADDYYVEKMVMALSSDMDKKRRKRMKDVPVFIWPGVKISPAKMNLLMDYFQVKIKEDDHEVNQSP